MPVIVSNQGPEVLYSWRKSTIKINKINGKIVIILLGEDDDLIKSKFGFINIVRGAAVK